MPRTSQAAPVCEPEKRDRRPSRLGLAWRRMIAKVAIPRKTAVAKKSCRKPSASHRPMIGMWKFGWNSNP